MSVRPRNSQTVTPIVWIVWLGPPLRLSRSTSGLQNLLKDSSPLQDWTNKAKFVPRGDYVAGQFNDAAYFGQGREINRHYEIRVNNSKVCV